MGLTSAEMRAYLKQRTIAEAVDGKLEMMFFVSRQSRVLETICSVMFEQRQRPVAESE